MASRQSITRARSGCFVSRVSRFVFRPACRSSRYSFRSSKERSFSSWSAESRIVREHLLEFSDGAEPKHLSGWSRASHRFCHFVERQALQVAQDDYLLIIGWQL